MMQLSIRLEHRDEMCLEEKFLSNAGDPLHLVVSHGGVRLFV
jgi:hypothetical protein